MVARWGGVASKSRALSAALVVLIGLAGCSLVGTEEPTDGPTDTAPTGTVPTDQRTIPPQLLECGDPNNKGADEQVELTEDLVASDAHWVMPAGFHQEDGYYDDLDYEQLSYLRTFVPDAPGYQTLDLLGVLGYTGLDWGNLARECGRVPLEAMLERVGEYQDLLGAEPLDEAEQVEIGGLPAVTQALSITEYDFRGYWLFSQTELLFIGCQWTDGGVRAEIESACSDLVASVQVG